MSKRIRLFQRLEGAQATASDPRATDVWLSASAGTGKTHVLTARVLRLLIGGARPDSILCLTFTKAAAAEMAERIQGRLAAWVRMKDADLRKELFALRERNDDQAIANARTLFARVLDAPGGLRIQTIHAFAQALLAGFPAEAGLSPGFRPIEGREEAALARSTLAGLLVEAEDGGDFGLIRDVQTLSRRLGEGAAESYLLDCARDPEGMAALGPREGIEARLRTALGVPLGDVEEHVAKACADETFDCETLRAVGALNGAWGTGRGLERADIVARWLTLDGAGRAAGLLDLHLVWAKSDGEIRSFGKGQAPQDSAYVEAATRLHGACAALLAIRRAAALAALLASGLRAGQAYALRYAAAKRGAGLVDFDDLIRGAERLLSTPGIGEWVRFKLDQATDHILVDEAQDTNPSQWRIVDALTEDYFAGEGARGRLARTLFTVGDFKQAIYGFQGTDPRAFREARDYFLGKARALNKSLEGEGEMPVRQVAELALDRSFRTTPPVLELVDRLIAEVGAAQLGLADPAEPHVAFKVGLSGTVTLWPPVMAEDEGGEGDEIGEEGWVDDASRRFAARVAEQIGRWLAEPLWLESEGRPLRPEDVLVLVRKRGTLASLIVARLHAEGVPVAGVDRLRLDAPLAVRDLLAAVRFAVQPEDDLTLAALLVSPLFGLSQDELYGFAFRRPRTLWQALRESGRHHAAVASLEDLLRAADFTTPYRFLEAILSGALDGRRRLIERLGEEARDPIEELLSSAIAFEAEATPTLQRFLDWFDRVDVEIKRDPSAPLDAVRVMTVHGAKGLEAPLVILADATVDPELAPARALDWSIGQDVTVPVFGVRKEERAAALAQAHDAAKAREREEHWRLLYVGLTRARERLVIGGALGPRAKGVPPQASWYAAAARALDSLGATAVEDPLWGAARHHRGGTPMPQRKRSERIAPPVTIPAWLHAPAPREARPPRPLAPSAVGRDLVAEPPPSPAMREGARRGSLLHALFERLPQLAESERMAAGDRWLESSAGVEDPALRHELLRAACGIIADPRFADIFGPESLAEAPVAAVVGTRVVAGTVDRLLVEPERVRVIDFKTGRRVPRSIEAAPEHHLVQIAAYVAALETIFPGRSVEAGLLYTAGPELLMMPPALVERCKRAFLGEEQKLEPAG